MHVQCPNCFLKHIQRNNMHIWVDLLNKIINLFEYISEQCPSSANVFTIMNIYIINCIKVEVLMLK